MYLMNNDERPNLFVYHVDGGHLVNRALVRNPRLRFTSAELVDKVLKLPAICAPVLLALTSRASGALVVLFIGCPTRRLVLDSDVVV